MRKHRAIEQNRCYHLISRLAHRAFFLDDEKKDRAVSLKRSVAMTDHGNSISPMQEYRLA